MNKEELDELCRPIGTTYVSDYNLENLVKTFYQHAEEVDDLLKKQIESFKKQFPESDLPDHYKNPFNFAKAMYVMAHDIEKLKDWQHRCKAD